MVFIRHEDLADWLDSLPEHQPVPGIITYDADGVWIDDDVPGDPGQQGEAS